jgi:CRISPR/Cas system-associated protein Cas5 (RAMP superfamily)
MGLSPLGHVPLVGHDPLERNRREHKRQDGRDKQHRQQRFGEHARRILQRLLVVEAQVEKASRRGVAPWSMTILLL